MPPTLTHKVIHRKCAELCARDGGAWSVCLSIRKLPCCIFTHGNKELWNQELSMPCMALHTILSTKNVQNLCAGAILSGERSRLAVLITVPSFYAICKYWYKSRTCDYLLVLHTILSTEYVQNWLNRFSASAVFQRGFLFPARLAACLIFNQCKKVV